MSEFRAYVEIDDRELLFRHTLRCEPVVYRLDLLAEGGASAQAAQTLARAYRRPVQNVQQDVGCGDA